MIIGLIAVLSLSIVHAGPTEFSADGFFTYIRSISDCPKMLKDREAIGEETLFLCALEQVQSCFL